MPEIKLLPKSIYELIAAGEVVEKPASVIKELLENSIDAGSKNITVEISGGGIQYIRVTDDGCGISRRDIRNAFVSHATSKIKTENDLNCIYTLGFRGEALASVAAVAKVDVITKTREEENGIHYCIEGGRELQLDDAGCPNGTTIVVSDLFYNTPARMKFLKKDVSEGNAAADIVDRIALSHPEVSIRFIRDGKQTLMTSGNGDLLSAAYSVLGGEFSKNVIPVDYSLEGISVKGYISKPVACRGSRSFQFVFLNGRYIKSGTVTSALEGAYKNSVMTGKFPACVLNLSVDASSVDVNVHPAKTEVRFSDERKIFTAVYYGCSDSLEKNDTRVKMEIKKPVERAFPEKTGNYSQLRMESRPKKDFWLNLTGEDFHGVTEKISSNKSGKILFNDSDIDKSATPLQEESLLSDYYGRLREKKSGASSGDTGFKITIKEPVFSKEESEKEPSEKKTELKQKSPVEFIEKVLISDEKKLPPVKVIGELFKTYILTEYGDRLYVIDKHALHERMIFNRLKKREIPSQVLLAPVTVRLEKRLYTALTDNLGALRDAGYSVEDVKTGEVAVTACPGIISPSEVQSQLEEIAECLSENNTDISTEKTDSVLHTMSCRAAVKAGDNTHTEEMESFVQTLLSDPKLRYCPHGRPVLIEITRNELEKQFGRIQ